MERKTYTWTKRDGKMELSDYDRADRQQYLNDVPEGGAVDEHLCRVRKKTTNQQIKAFFGMIVQAAWEEMLRAGWDVRGVPITKDQAKAVVYDYCANKDENGKSITLSSHPQSSTFNTMELFDHAQSWLATEFGRYVPDPDPQWRKRLTKA